MDLTGKSDATRRIAPRAAMMFAHAGDRAACHAYNARYGEWKLEYAHGGQTVIRISKKEETIKRKEGRAVPQSVTVEQVARRKQLARPAREQWQLLSSTCAPAAIKNGPLSLYAPPLSHFRSLLAVAIALPSPAAPTLLYRPLRPVSGGPRHFTAVHPFSIPQIIPPPPPPPPKIRYINSHSTPHPPPPPHLNHICTRLNCSGFCLNCSALIRSKPLGILRFLGFKSSTVQLLCSLQLCNYEQPPGLCLYWQHQLFWLTWTVFWPLAQSQ